MLLPSRLGVRVDGNNMARMMHRAFRVNANGARSARTFAVDDDGRLWRSTLCDRLRVFIFGFRCIKLGVLPA